MQWACLYLKTISEKTLRAGYQPDRIFYSPIGLANGSK
jgi:hypothetical protein